MQLIIRDLIYRSPLKRGSKRIHVIAINYLKFGFGKNFRLKKILAEKIWVLIWLQKLI